MEYTFLNVFKLIVATLIPVILSVAFILLDKKTKFKNIKTIYRILIIGFVFGVASIGLIELGIDGIVWIELGLLAPLTCGLIFGEASIIALLIGGLYRYLFTLFHQTNDILLLSSILGIVLSGLIGWIVKRFVFDNKKVNWIFGFIIGIFADVMFMLLIFLTKMDSIKSAYTIVSSIVIPLMICTALSTSLSTFLADLIEKIGIEKIQEKTHISQIFQYMLLVVILGTFSLTSYITYYFQTKVAESDYSELLTVNMYDIKIDVVEYTDNSLLSEVQTISKYVSLTTSTSDLKSFSSQFDVYELDVVADDGIVKNSNIYEKVNSDLSSDSNLKSLLNSIKNSKYFINEMVDLNDGSSLSSIKYVAVKLDSGFLLAGYSLSQYQNILSDQYINAISNRHIGESGDICVFDEELNSLYDRVVLGGVETPKESIEKLNSSLEKIMILPIHGEDCFSISFKVENLLFVIYYPASQALINRNIGFMLMAFMEAIAYCLLFCVIYVLLDKSIVKNVHKINKSLEKITLGHLDEKIDVRANFEFDSLSNDINCTVTTLKSYIEKEKHRNEEEVKLARDIQQSSLPNIFPAFPNRTDFDIYASMVAAKEVGGDFYDFYLTNKNHLVFLIADVSGKGIPAAMFMMKAKAIIKNLVESGKSIDEAFNQANLYLLEGNKARMFVTAWIGLLDLRNGRLEYVNAGHNPPLIVKNNGEVMFINEKPNFVLAGSKKSKYVKHELSLDINDSIFLYTDGISEAMNENGELYLSDRLKNVLSKIDRKISPKEICLAVKNDVDSFVNGAEQSDDMTMLSVKISYFSSSDMIATLPNMESYSKVVTFIDERLDKLSIDPKIKGKAMIALDEIYSNIVKYSKASKAVIRLSKEENILCLQFEYDGIKFDFHDAENPDVSLPLNERKQGGLGLFIVRKTAYDVTYEYKDYINFLSVKYKLFD